MREKNSFQNSGNFLPLGPHSGKRSSKARTLNFGKGVTMKLARILSGKFLMGSKILLRSDRFLYCIGKK